MLLALVPGQLVAKRTVLRHFLGKPVLQRPDKRRQRPGKQLPERGCGSLQNARAQPRELRAQPVKPARLRVVGVRHAHSSASSAMIAARTARRSARGIAA